MRNYNQFHDGYLEGFWINDSTMHVYLSTMEKERFAAVVTGVVALSARGFKTGNLILSIRSFDHSEISVEDISEVYDYKKTPEDKIKAARLLEKAQKDQLVLFVISPSYGATCLVLGHAVEVLTQKEWSGRYGTLLLG
jgi:hypothetical protein